MPPCLDNKSLSTRPLTGPPCHPTQSSGAAPGCSFGVYPGKGSQSRPFLPAPRMPRLLFPVIAL
ncbi:hypothetical protein DCCM_3376 [Desulfocucumis palustris]|uniref:Uncharacterized protein n=1 Tax=Desulfocucumis palustris TaxID=1898651 RepID=A0A2L2XE17_9FIRM|nr:hypothetical protein DCCM_3376 [Desulfocucumis palustris]